MGCKLTKSKKEIRQEEYTSWNILSDEGNNTQIASYSLELLNTNDSCDDSEALHRPIKLCAEVHNTGQSKSPNVEQETVNLTAFPGATQEDETASLIHHKTTSRENSLVHKRLSTSSVHEFNFNVNASPTSRRKTTETVFFGDTEPVGTDHSTQVVTSGPTPCTEIDSTPFEAIRPNSTANWTVTTVPISCTERDFAVVGQLPLLALNSSAEETTQSTIIGVAKDLKVSFVLNGEQNEYSWKKADLKVYLPCVYSHFNGRHIDFTVCDIDSFTFPHRTKPVSAIFKASTDLSVEVILMLEHCFRGNQRDLAFAYCRYSHPPFHFRIANRQEYECSFTYAHGTIRTKLYPYWVILRRYNHSLASLDTFSHNGTHDSEDQQNSNENCCKSCVSDQGKESPYDGGGGKAKSSSRAPSGQSVQSSSYGQSASYNLYPSRKRHHCDDSEGGEEGGESGGNGSASPQEAMSWSCDDEEISIIPFYQIVSTHIKMNIIVTKKLHVNHEKLRIYYDPLIWSFEQPTFGVQFNDHTVTLVRVKVDKEWEDIENHWQWKYASPPVISKKDIEKHYGAIKLLYRCTVQDAAVSRTLDHGVTLEGLKIMDYPAHINYIIDRGDILPSSSMSFRDYFGQPAPVSHDICLLINRATNKRFKLGEKIASSWKRVGSTLGLRLEALATIERDVIHHHSDEDRLMEVLKSWFENASQLPHHRYYPLSWKGLFNLLKDSDREEDAREFFRFLDAMV